MGNSDSKLAEFKQSNADRIKGLEDSKNRAKKNVQAILKAVSSKEAALREAPANEQASLTNELEGLRASLKTEQDYLSKAQSTLESFAESAKAKEASFSSDLSSTERQFQDEFDLFKESSLRGLSDAASRKVGADFCDAQDYVHAPLSAIFSSEPVRERVARMALGSSEQASAKVASSLGAINVALVGRPKAWKQAAAHSVLGLSNEQTIATIEGVPVEGELSVYSSEKCKHFKLYCTQGLRAGYSAANALREAQEAVTPGCIHAVWYTLPATDPLSENGDFAAVLELSGVLQKVGVPLIIVLTQAKSADSVPSDINDAGLSDIPVCAITSDDNSRPSCIKNLVELTVNNICKCCAASAAEPSSKPRPKPSQVSPYVAQARKDFRKALFESLEERKSTFTDEKKRSSVVKKLRSAASSGVETFKSNATAALAAWLVASVEDGRKVELMAAAHLGVMVGNVVRWAESEVDSLFTELTEEPLGKANTRVEELITQFKTKYGMTPECPWDKEGVSTRQYVIEYKNGAVRKNVEVAILDALCEPFVAYFAEECATALDDAFTESHKANGDLNKVIDDKVLGVMKKVPNEHKKEVAGGIWKLF